MVGRVGRLELYSRDYCLDCCWDVMIVDSSSKKCGDFLSGLVLGQKGLDVGEDFVLRVEGWDLEGMTDSHFSGYVRV